MPETPAPLTLATPRLRLRRLAPSDLADFQAYRTDPEVGRWQGWTATGEAAAGLFLAQMARAPLFVPGAWCQLGIALGPDLDPPDGDRLVGDIGVHRDRRDPTRAEIGFSLHRHWQGRGLATEALGALRAHLRTLGVRRIEAVVDARNDASLRLLDRLGFARDRLEDAVFRGEPAREWHLAWVAADAA